MILESSSLGLGIGIGIDSFGLAKYQSVIRQDNWGLIAGLIVSVLHDENDHADEEVQDSIVTSSCSSSCSCWCWWSFEIDHMAQCDLEETQRCEKISNSSSFGIIDIADSSTTDRIIVIVDTDCFIHDGAYR